MPQWRTQFGESVPPKRFLGSILGIALLLLVRDGRRIYVVSLAYASQSIAQGLNMYIAAALFAALALLCYLQPQITLSNTKALSIAASIILSITTLFIYLPEKLFVTQASPLVMLFVYSLFTFCSFFLLIVWMEHLRNLTMREWFLLLGCALLCSSCLEFFTVGLKTTAAVVLLVLAPLASLALLMQTQHKNGHPAQKSLAPLNHLAKRPFASAIIAMVLFFFVTSLSSNSQYTIERASLALGIDGVSMQITYETGIALAGSVFCLTAMFLWLRETARFLPLLIPACFGLMYVVSNIGEGSVAFLALSPLALMLKLSSILPLLFMQIMRERFTFAACIVAVVSPLGGVLGAAPLFRNAVDPGSIEYGLVIALLLSMLLALSFVLILLNPSQHDRKKVVGSTTSEQVNLKEQAVLLVAADHRLTPRETEILAYLADGWRSSTIAEKMVLSQTTVKNHMGRIYKKLNVHSQQEIMTLIDDMAIRMSGAQEPTELLPASHTASL